MRGYELTLLLRDNTTVDDIQLVLGSVVRTLRDFDSTVKYGEYWGLRKLRYKICGCKRAYFYAIRFIGDSVALRKLDSLFKVSSSIIRHLLIQIDTDNSVMMTPSSMIRAIEKDKKGKSSDSQDSADDVVFNEQYTASLKNMIGN